MKEFMVFAILLISTSTYSQEDVSLKNESELDVIFSRLSTMYFTEVDMDIDLKVYEASDEGNIYGTANKDSAIIAVVFPTSDFKDIYSEMEEGAKLIEKRRKVVDEKPIIFLKHKKEIDEKTYVRLVYFKKDNKDFSILISSFYEEEKESKYEKLIERAAFSAKIKE